MTNAKIIALEAEADDLEDAAMNFVEGTIGRRGFPTNWTRLRASEKSAMAMQAMARETENFDPEALVMAIDRLADSGLLWRR